MKAQSRDSALASIFADHLGAANVEAWFASFGGRSAKQDVARQVVEQGLDSSAAGPSCSRTRRGFFFGPCPCFLVGGCVAHSTWWVWFYLFVARIEAVHRSSLARRERTNGHEWFLVLRRKGISSMSDGGR